MRSNVGFLRLSKLVRVNVIITSPLASACHELYLVATSILAVSFRKQLMTISTHHEEHPGNLYKCRTRALLLPRPTSSFLSFHLLREMYLLHVNNA